MFLFFLDSKGNIVGFQACGWKNELFQDIICGYLVFLSTHILREMQQRIVKNAHH